VVRRVFGDVLPTQLLHFLLITIDKRRQRLLRAIATEYATLLDAHEGRAHVEVTLARPMDEATRGLLAERLTEMLGKKAIPHLRVKPEIIGGIMMRTGDTIYDGSIRRRLEAMRHQLMHAQLPADGQG
jgi:F-type H+-transporting ATPase subunit delta